MPSDPANRTLVLSVVAVDLVGYSRKSVAEQMSLKDGFNHLLLQAICDISVADRIILDTGDGVAIGFLGDPEDALYVAMFMHDAINRDGSADHSGGIGSKAIRIGINLGPVKLATGAGGHPNIIGDGINVAERIMGFAEPGQLTASRPFYEVMSRMSDHYATLFQFAGPHTDKQVRVHDVYIVGNSPAAFRHAQRGIAERAGERGGRPTKEPAVSLPSSSLHLASPTSPQTPPHTTPQASPWPAAAPPAAKAVSIAARDSHIATTLPAEETGNANTLQDRLIDFLEDRNKVATTAMLLGVMVVILAALLAYRKMAALLTDSPMPPVAMSPAAESRPADSPPITSSSTTAPVPTPVAPANVAAAAAPTAAKPADTDTRPALPTKVDAKGVPPTVATRPGTSAAPAVPSGAPAGANTPGKTPPAPTASARTEPKAATTAERAPTTGNTTSPAAAMPDTRDKPKESRVEKTDKSDRTGTRDDARKPATPRTTGERERAGPGATAPVVPAYQSPVEAPRPEVVAPTPAPAPKPADTEIVVVSRSAPVYPVEASRQGITSGFVRAKLTIDANGNVSDVEILESRPISAFGRETRSSAKQWKYNRGAPARIQEIEITFKP